MEKLKAYYDEHKQAVIWSAIGTGAVAGIMALRFINGQKLASASLYLRDDGRAALIVVAKKNGTSESFIKIIEKEAAAA